MGQVNGVVNATGNTVNIYATSTNLLMGQIVASGDPLIADPVGPVIITTGSTEAGGQSTNGQPLTIISGSDILSDGTGTAVLDTSVMSGSGGNLTLIAGASFKAPVVGKPLTISKGTAAGGLIDLTGDNVVSGLPIQTITTSTSDLTGGNAGNIMMIAFGGSSQNAGQVVISTPITAISAAGAGGNITIIAGGHTSVSNTGNAINDTGAISTTGITAAGNVLLSNAASSGSLKIVTSGATAGAITGTPKAGTLTVNGAGVTMGAATTGGGNVTVASTGPVTIGSGGGEIKTDHSGPDVFNGGNVSVSGSTITLDGPVSANGKKGTTFTNPTTDVAGPAGRVGGLGGNISFISGAGGFSASDPTDTITRPVAPAAPGPPADLARARSQQVMGEPAVPAEPGAQSRLRQPSGQSLLTAMSSPLAVLVVMVAMEGRLRRPAVSAGRAEPVAAQEPSRSAPLAQAKLI